MSTSANPIQDLREDIRAVGLRATPARVSALRFVREASSPVTHADVAEKLSDDGVDKATAFRNLNDLADAGLLRRTELGDHVYRFEEIRPGEVGSNAHPHFLCSDCGAVSCLDNVKLTAGSLRESNQIGEVTEILLRGTCHSCLEQAGDE